MKTGTRNAGWTISRRGFVEASGLLAGTALISACSAAGGTSSDSGVSVEEDAAADAGVGTESGDDSAFDAHGFAERGIEDADLMTKAVHADIQPVPESYFDDCDHPGTIEAFGYETQTYGDDGAGDGKTFTKTCNVYLPVATVQAAISPSISSISSMEQAGMRARGLASPIRLARMQRGSWTI